MPRTSIYNKDFILVIIGQIISLTANGILRFALPLHLLRETGSTGLFGTVMAISVLPQIVLSLFGGVIADRKNKRNIMVGLDILATVIVSAYYFTLNLIPVVALTVLTLMVLQGIAGVYSPAVYSALPLLVPKQSLMTANGAVTFVQNGSLFIAPLIGGAVYGYFGITTIMIVSGVSLCISAIFELFIYIPFEPEEHHKTMLQLVKQDLLEAIGYATKTKPVLFQIMMLMAAINITYTATYLIGFPVAYVQYLGVSDLDYGFAQSLIAIGGIIGGLLAMVLAKHIRDTLLTAEFIVWSLFTISIGFITQFLPPDAAYWSLTIIGGLISGVQAVINIHFMTKMQVITPNKYLGKMVSLMTAVFLTTTPFAQLGGGWLFELFPTQIWLPFAIAGLIGLLSTIYYRHSITDFLNAPPAE